MSDGYLEDRIWPRAVYGRLRGADRVCTGVADCARSCAVLGSICDIFLRYVIFCGGDLVSRLTE